MTTECTPNNLADYVKNELGGKLMRGAHTHEPECCILEARSLCMGLEKTDDPKSVGRPDIRPLNDALWPNDKLRAKHMLRLDAALSWWPYDPARRERFTERLVIRTVNVLIAGLPGLPADVSEKCSEARTLSEAAQAARAAWTAWTAQAVWKARAAREAWAAARANWSSPTAEAERAARAAEAAWAAARAADAETKLVQAVDLWIECAEASGN